MRALTALMMMLTLGGCMNSPSGTAVDRLQGPASRHAAALAGDDMVKARATGRELLALLEAYAGW